MNNLENDNILNKLGITLKGIGITVKVFACSVKNVTHSERNNVQDFAKLLVINDKVNTFL